MAWKVVDLITSDQIKAMLGLEKVKTDTFVFRLHYKLSIWLVAFYSIVYTYIAIKDPINCIASSGKKLVNLKSLNEFCWTSGTYSVINLNLDDRTYPGIGQINRDSEIVYHHYYRWMYLFIFAMFIILYSPRYFWYCIENGIMRRLVKCLHKVLPFGEKETIDRQKKMLIEFLSTHLGYHNRYAYGFVLAEIFNVLVTLTLMFIWDHIAGHEFSKNGAPIYSIMTTPFRFRKDRFATIFPLLGKCTLNTYGPGGGIQPNDAVCVLPLNITNERAAVFFWYYLMVLLAIGAGAVLFRIAVISSRRLRIFLLGGLTPLTSLEDIAVLNKHCSYADWFFIYQLGSVLEPTIFRQILMGFIHNLRSYTDV